MANPTRGSWERLKKARTYLRGVEKVTWVMRAWKYDRMTVDAHVASDWAKGPERKLTSGGMMMVIGTRVGEAAGCAAPMQIGEVKGKGKKAKRAGRKEQGQAEHLLPEDKSTCGIVKRNRAVRLLSKSGSCSLT